MGILVGVAWASRLTLTLGVHALSVDTAAATNDSDPLLLGRGRKLMVRECEDGIGVASGSQLSVVLSFWLGVVRCLGEPLEGKARTAVASPFGSGRGVAPMATVAPSAGSEGLDVWRIGVTLRCGSGLEMRESPWLSFRRNLLGPLLWSTGRGVWWMDFSLRPTMVDGLSFAR